MADNSVFITGAAKGAFEDALATLPPWATEKTANKISGLLLQQVKILNDINKASGKGGSGGTGGLSPTDQTKYTSELEKALKLIIANNKEEEKALKRHKEREAADKKALFGVKEFDNKWQKYQFVLDGLAVVGKKVLDADKQYLKTYDAMYQSGVNVLAGQNEFTDGFQALNHVVTQTGVKLETLQEVAQKYSSAINAYGFMKFAKTLSISTKSLTELGFSSKASADLIGSYTETAQNYSDMRRRSEQEMADDAIKFGANITKLSLATGVAREQMLANAKAVSKSSDISLIYAKYGKAGADKMLAFASSFPDQGLGKELVTMAADTVPALNATFQDLAKSGLGQFGGQLQAIMRNAANEDPLVTRKRIASLMDTITDGQRQFIRTLVQGGVQSATHTQDILTNLTQVSHGLGEASGKQVDAAITTESSIAKLDTQMERFGASMQAAFSPTIAQINKLGTALESFNDVIYKVINHTDAETRSWAGVGLMAASGAAGAMGTYGTAKTIMNLFKGARTAGAVAEGGAAAEGVAASGAVAGGASAATVLGVAAAGIFAAYETSRLGMALKDLWDAKHHEGVKLNAETQARIDSGELEKRKAELNTPARSTISSPSASKSSSNSEWDDDSTPSAGMPTIPMAPGIEKTRSGSDINNTLVAQNNLLEQIRLAAVKQVETSESILKYTRNKT